MIRSAAPWVIRLARTSRTAPVARTRDGSSLTPKIADGRILVLVACFLVLGMPFPVGADTLPFTSLEFPPYNYEEDTRVTGFTTDVVRRIVRRMGHTPTVDLLPWERAQAEAARGKYAGIFTFTKSVERMRKFRYTAPVARIKDVFFKRRSDTINWRTLRDLSKYEIGMSPYNYADVFQNAVENGTLAVQVVHSETPEILHLRKLKHRRIDLAICELRLCQFLLEEHSPDFRGIDYLERPIGPVRTFHIGISREWPNARELTQEFNRQLARMASDGSLESLRRKHFSGGEVDQPPRDFLHHLVDDLRMFSRTHTVPGTDGDRAEPVSRRLRRTVDGHVQTLGWDQGTALVAWVRNGQFSIQYNGSPGDDLPSSNSRSGQRGVLKKAGSYTGRLLTEDEVPSLEGSVLEVRANDGKTAVGGYLLFDGSGVLHNESTVAVERGRKIPLRGWNES